jgi:hypothetical protein
VKAAKSTWGSVVARWCGCDEPSELAQAATTHPTATPRQAATTQHNTPLQRALPTKPGLITIPTRSATTTPATTIPSDERRTDSLAARILRDRSGPGTTQLPPPTTRGLGGYTLSDADRAAISQMSRSTIDALEWQSHLNTARAVIADEYSRQKVLCAELRQGFASGMIRSWIVMLLFAIGLGLAPMAEEKLRPIDYPSSRTRRNDRILAGVLAVLVIGGALVVRFTRH